MAKKATDAVEVVFSFDTTGSMYPCLTQVRTNLKETVKDLFADIPNIKIGVIAHGDYCDEGDTYVTKILDLTDDQAAITKFVDKVESTGGGDSPECYELVLREARSLNWSAGKKRLLVMIGDDVPHGPNYALNKKKIDWRNELDMLLESSINVHGVHCMPGIRTHSRSFYEEIAKKTGGFYLTLDQFSSITDLVMAVCYNANNDNTKVEQLEKQLVKNGRMNRGMSQVFGTLLGRKSDGKFSGINMKAVDPGRFQVLSVKKDFVIADFVKKNGLKFKTGRGFYEFTKSVKVQSYKEVVLLDNTTGDMYSGDRARQIAGIPIGYDATVSPGKGSLANYTCFIQSTSNNRKLLGGTKFLYEVED
jgi:hypothetical protein